MSETFRPVNENLSINDSYSDIVLLREGAMSRLYRVSKAGKYLVIKTTKDNLAMQLAMLKREYELSIKLEHYHLPHFYTYEANSPVGPGIVMEYIDGRNLSDFLAEKPSIDSRRRVFSQLLTVVAFIHKNGIIHNDLKPENILITRANDDVKLLDFGLSNTDAHYLTKNMGGTREYASPELLAQKEDLDARSDIYSLGKIMQLIFPKNYKSYSSKCLCENPNDRWENVDQLIRSWNKSSHPGYFILIAIMAVMAAVMFFFMYNRNSDNPHRQELLDSLSIARNEVNEAQQQALQAKQEASDAQQEASNAQQEATDARNEALLAQQQFDSIRNVQALSEAEKQQWEAEKNAAVNELAQSLDKCYRSTLDTINNVPFSEFVLSIQSSYQKNANNILLKCLSLTTDDTIQIILKSIYPEIIAEHVNKIYDKMLAKPSFRSMRDKMSEDEYNFYKKLYDEYLPYRKYVPIKNK